MLREWASTGLVAAVHFLFPPVPLSFTSIKTDFDFAGKGPRPPPANLRYLVMDQVDHSHFRVIQQAVQYDGDIVPVAG